MESRNPLDTPKKSFSFWKAPIGDQDIIKRNKAHIDWLLETTQFQGQCEKIWVAKHLSIQSSRFNDANRLITTTIKVSGKSYLLVLEEVLSHDYQKSRFMQPGVLRDYLDKHNEEILEQIAQLEENGSEQKTLEQKPTITLPRIEFDNNKFIELDDAQAEAAATQLPLIVSGAAGSGKTTVAYAQLLDAIADAKQGETLLYVAKSKRLVAEMEKRFNQQTLHPPGVTVKFLTYDELLLSQHPELAQLEKTNEENFIEWYKEIYLPKLRNEHKAKSDSKGKGKDKNKELFPFNLEEARKIYEECRTLCAYEETQYYDLGKEQCLCHAKHEKENIVKTFQAYKTYLASSKKYDPAFQVMKANHQYHFVAVDEAQDLSNLQLRQLASLTQDQQICFFMDTHQNLFDSQSKRPFLVTELGKSKFGVRHRQLPIVYRCPSLIAAFAKKLIDVKNTITRGISDKLEQYELRVKENNKNEGSVTWHEKWDQQLIQQLKNKHKANEFAIITEPEYREEAEQLFGTALVFTPEEIKGLEYPTIVTYRLFDNQKLKEDNDILQDIPTEEYGKIKHKAKDGESNRDHVTLFNRLFTAVTRTSDKLHVFQKKHHYIKHICDYLDPPTQTRNELLPAPAPSIAPEVTATREELMKTVETLIANETTISQARKFFLQHKLGTVADFNNLIKPESSAETKSESSPASTQIKNTVAEPKKGDESKLITSSSMDTFVRNAFNNLTEKNLITIINDKNAMRFLFGGLSTPLNGRPCLIDAIRTDLKRSRIFTNLLENNAAFRNTLIDKLKENLFKSFYIDDTKHSINPFCYLLNNDNLSWDFFNGIVERHRKFLQEITAADLCSIPNHYLNTQHNLPILYYWLKNENLPLHLLEIIRKNPNILMGITAESLCALETLPDDWGKLSALFFLSLKPRPESESILFRLFEKQPQLYKSITPEALFTVNQFFNDMRRLSVFYSLVAFPAYKSIALEFIKQQPALHQFMPADTLFSQVTEKNPQPLFYLLAVNSAFHPFLLSTLKYNLSLISYITSEGLTHTPVPHDIRCLTPLFVLTAPGINLELINSIIDFNPTLLKAICFEHLTRPVYLNEETSTLLSWNSHDEGKALLNQWLNHHPEDRHLVIEYLEKNQIRRFSQEEKDTHTKHLNYISNLCTNLTTQKIQNLLKHEDAILYLFGTFYDRIDNENCLLYYITKDKDRLAKFKSVLENPTYKHLFLEKLKDKLFSPLSIQGTKNPGFPFYALTQFESFRNLLVEFFTAHPLTISAKDLCTEIFDDIAIRSLLFSFASYPLFHPFLLDAFKRNPNIAREITAEALCRIDPETGASALFMFCMNQDFTVLEEIFKAQPTIGKYINADALFITQNQGSDIVSAYSHLSHHPTGKWILDNIFSHQPHLARLAHEMRSGEPVTRSLQTGLNFFGNRASQSEPSSSVERKPAPATSAPKTNSPPEQENIRSNSHYDLVVNLFNNFTPQNFEKILNTKNAMLYLFGKLQQPLNGFWNLYDAISFNQQKATILFKSLNEKKIEELFLDKLKDQLFSPLSVDDKENALIPFFRLSSDPRLHLFNRLMEKHKKFILSNLSGKDLCAVSYSVSDVAPVPIIHLMARNSYLHPFLKEIFNSKATLAKDISAAALCASPNTSGDENTESTLFILTHNKALHPIIIDIFKQQPELTKEIHADTLFKVHHLLDGERSCLFFKLLASMDFHFIIFDLFNKQPELFELITADALFTPLRPPIANKAALTVFFNLLSISTLQKLLFTMLQKKPLLAVHISRDMLVFPYESHNNTGNVSSVLYRLTKTNNFESINSIFDLKPALLNDITFEDLIQTAYNKQNNSYTDSILFRWNSSAEGLKLLERWLQQHPQDRKRVVQFLKDGTINPGNNIIDPAVFISLSMSPEGRQKLRDIFSKQPALFDKLTKEALFNTAKDAAANRDAMYHLMMSTETHSFLIQLFTKQPYLTKEITAAKLCWYENTTRQYNSVISKITTEKPPLLYLLTDAFSNFELIDILIKNNPDILKQLTFNQLTEKYFFAYPENKPRSISESLKSHENGKAFLRKWLAFHRDDLRYTEYLKEFEMEDTPGQLAEHQIPLVFFGNANQQTTSSSSPPQKNAVTRK